MSDQNLQAGMVNPSYGQQEPAPHPRNYPDVPQRIIEPPRENTIRAISIRQLSHGYIVEVGCQTFAIESASTLIAKLSEYILNPNFTESKHREGKLF
jgi:hypothetical protein